MALNDIRTAEELSAWMKRMNLSLTSAAEQLGRKRGTIARYVNGITDLPESVARHAAVIEASRSGQPFENRMVRRSSRSAMA